MKRFLFVIVFLGLLSACSKDQIVHIIDNDEQTSFVSLDFNPQFLYDDLRIVLKSEATGKIFGRRAKVLMKEGMPSLAFDKALEDGNYVFLYYYDYSAFSKSVAADGEQEVILAHGLKEHSLGMSVQIDDRIAKILDHIDPEVMLFGEGTKDIPYKICTGDDMERLARAVNKGNAQSFAGKYIVQLCDVQLPISTVGFEPIGCRSTFPFMGSYDGRGYTIYNLDMNNQDYSAWALFGYVYGATIHHVNIMYPRILCQDFAAPLVAVVMTPGDKVVGEARGLTYIHHCHVKGGEGAFVKGKAGIGGLVASVDQYAVLKMSACTTDVTVQGAFGVGGLLGMGVMASTVVADSCENMSVVSTVSGEQHYSGIGGVIGVADTCSVYLCKNKGKVSSPMSDDAKGVGGIVGGSGCSIFAACTNEGTVSGGRGVGGLLGSNVLKIADDENDKEGSVYQSTLVNGGKNLGKIEAYKYAGGLIGEGQAMLNDCYNKGFVVSTEGNAGGLIANSPTLFTATVANFGQVSGVDRTGGICGVSRMNHIIDAFNFGEIVGNGKDNVTGGIIGESGNNGNINYAYNYGKVKNLGAGSVTGGVAGMLGENKEFTPLEIASMAIASLGLVVNTTGAAFSIYTAKVPAAASRKADIAFDTYALADFAYTEGVNIYTFCNYRDGYYEEMKLNDERLMDAVRAQNAGFESEIVQEITNGINQYQTKVSDELQGGLSDAKVYSQNFASAISASDNDLLQRIAVNMDEEMNAKRKEEVDENDTKTLTVSIMTTILAVIAGVCAIVSLCGVGSALVMGSIGVAVSVTSGVTSLYGGASSFEENVGMIRQCANYGEIEVGDSYWYAGGIVGVMNDYTIMSDCFNWGGNRQGLTGGLVGRIGDSIEADRCMNFSSDWSKVYQNFYGAADPVWSLRNFKVYGVSNSTSTDCAITYCPIEDLTSGSKIYEAFDKNFWDMDNIFPIHKDKSVYDF